MEIIVFLAGFLIGFLVKSLFRNKITKNYDVKNVKTGEYRDG